MVNVLAKVRIIWIFVGVEWNSSILFRTSQLSSATSCRSATPPLWQLRYFFSDRRRILYRQLQKILRLSGSAPAGGNGFGEAYSASKLPKHRFTRESSSDIRSMHTQRPHSDAEDAGKLKINSATTTRLKSALRAVWFAPCWYKDRKS